MIRHSVFTQPNATLSQQSLIATCAPSKQRQQLDAKIIIYQSVPTSPDVLVIIKIVILVDCWCETCSICSPLKGASETSGYNGSKLTDTFNHHHHPNHHNHHCHQHQGIKLIHNDSPSQNATLLSHSKVTRTVKIHSWQPYIKQALPTASFYPICLER